jgi:hypothetical protein
MRRRLRVQILFEPARSSAAHLRYAYELLRPVAVREVRAPTAGHDPERRGQQRPRREEAA